MKPHYKLKLNGKIVRLGRRPFEPTFLSILLRLKVQLVLLHDSEIAKALGMAATAFHDRKERESFPIKNLWALSAQRPDLKLDVGYILTGERKAEPATPDFSAA